MRGRRSAAARACVAGSAGRRAGEGGLQSRLAKEMVDGGEGHIWAKPAHAAITWQPLSVLSIPDGGGSLTNVPMALLLVPGSPSSDVRSAEPPGMRPGGNARDLRAGRAAAAEVAGRDSVAGASIAAAASCELLASTGATPKALLVRPARGRGTATASAA